MNARKSSLIWKRTIYYFLVVFFLFSLGILFFTWQVGHTRTRQNISWLYNQSLHQARLAFLQGLQNPKAADTQTATGSSIQSLIDAEQNSLQQLNQFKEAKGTIKNSQNDESLDNIISSGNQMLLQQPATSSILREFEKLHWKFMAVFSIFCLGMIGMMLVLIRMILLPLEKIIKGAQKVSRGDLSTSFQVQSRDELGQLATVLQDLTTNTSELLFLISNTHSKGQELLTKLQTAIQQGDQQKQQELVQEIQMLHSRLREVTDYFQYKKPDL